MLRLLRLGSTKVERPERVDPLGGLTRLAADGDMQALRTLLVELGPALLRSCRAVLGASHPEVEDALQDSMAALVTALPGFRGESSVRHFASRVAVQTALRTRRKTRLRSKYVVTSDDELNELASPERSPSEESAALRRRVALRELLLELPEIHSEVLALHVMLGFTIEESAAALSVPVNTVRSRLRRALASLRDSVQADANLLGVLRAEA